MAGEDKVSGVDPYKAVDTKDLTPLPRGPESLSTLRGPYSEKIMDYQGGYTPKGDVPRTEQDVETERLSRMADYLNNYKAMQSMTLPGGDLLKGSITAGGAMDLGKLNTEDLLQQGKRRDYENARRTWEGGLTQQTTMFDQNMKLLSLVRMHFNKLLNDALTARTTSDTSDFRTRNYLESLQGLTHDERSALSLLADSLLWDAMDADLRSGISVPAGLRLPESIRKQLEEMLDGWNKGR